MQLCNMIGILPLQVTDELYAWASLPVNRIGKAQMHEIYYYASCLEADGGLTALLNAFAWENRRAFDHLTRTCMRHIHAGLLEFETLLRYQTQLHAEASFG